MSLADMVEDVNEGGVGLSVDFLQLDSYIVDLLQGLAAEEVWCVIILAQYGIILGSHHWSELCKVTYHQQLHTAEGAGVVAIASQHRVDGVEQVAPHHTDLVDD